ncbi:MAG TPA: hypothetical protein VI959_02395 [Alphaproteobacteria bacterium]|nr:hypothetical protein [Alphaproteobacteria bacterium]
MRNLLIALCVFVTNLSAFEDDLQTPESLRKISSPILKRDMEILYQTYFDKKSTAATKERRFFLWMLSFSPYTETDFLEEIASQQVNDVIFFKPSQNSLSKLPDEILSHISSYLDRKSTRFFINACPEFYREGRENFFNFLSCQIFEVHPFKKVLRSFKTGLKNTKKSCFLKVVGSLEITLQAKRKITLSQEVKEQSYYLALKSILPDSSSFYKTILFGLDAKNYSYLLFKRALKEDHKSYETLKSLIHGRNAKKYPALDLSVKENIIKLIMHKAQAQRHADSIRFLAPEIILNKKKNKIFGENYVTQAFQILTDLSAGGNTLAKKELRKIFKNLADMPFLIKNNNFLPLISTYFAQQLKLSDFSNLAAINYFVKNKLFLRENLENFFSAVCEASKEQVMSPNTDILLNLIYTKILSADQILKAEDVLIQKALNYNAKALKYFQNKKKQQFDNTSKTSRKKERRNKKKPSKEGF